jgi:hypothetical protein
MTSRAFPETVMEHPETQRMLSDIRSRQAPIRSTCSRAVQLRPYGAIVEANGI